MSGPSEPLVGELPPLDARYAELRARCTASGDDFQASELEKSRALFDMSAAAAHPTPKRFDVFTSVVGLPLGEELARHFGEIVRRVRDVAEAAGARAYWVRPELLHWELFIFQRPGEAITPEQLREAQGRMRQALAEQPPFQLDYRGFLFTPDGTLLVQGFGDFDGLRARLADQIPFASPKQSRLGHVSLGRILDPVGPEAFARLQRMVEESQTVRYGSLRVAEAQIVHERQWYMEDHEVVARLPLGA